MPTQTILAKLTGRSGVRGVLAAAVVAALIAGLVGVVATTPARAFEIGDVQKSGWAYTDARRPSQSFINPAGDAPVGAWTDADGRKHRSRSYFTFDVARFRAMRIHSADLVIAERSAAKCAQAQPVELWRTDPIAPTTSWDSPPQRRERIGTVLAGGPAACPGYLVWDVMPVLQKLADRNASTLTVEIRVPHRFEAALDHGRRLIPFPVIHVESNSPPTVARAGLEFPDGRAAPWPRPRRSVPGRTT